MAELLIYIVPIFAGIIGSRYLSRLANFTLMVVVFQLDIGLLFGQFGHFSLLALTPYTVVCVIPALAGMVGYRYFGFGNVGNTFLIIVVFYLGSVLFASSLHRRFIPLLFLQAIFISAGDLVPPLVFILVAIAAHPLRRFATP